MRFYTTEQLGEKQSLTPEKFLLCEEVPVARTGVMIYGPGETPIPPGKDGIVKINRDDAEVFNPDFLASLSGKPVVNDHPTSDVTPLNWRGLAVGVGLNPRRGSGLQTDMVVMDLLITDPDAIEIVRQKKNGKSLSDTTPSTTRRPKARERKRISSQTILRWSMRAGAARVARSAIVNQKEQRT